MDTQKHALRDGLGEKKMDPRELENGEHLARYMQGLEEEGEGIYGVMEDIRAAMVRDALRKALAEKKQLQDENRKLQDENRKLQDGKKELQEAISNFQSEFECLRKQVKELEEATSARQGH